MATMQAPLLPAHAKPQPPYGAYAAIVGVFAGGLGVAGLLSRSLGRDPQCQTTLDLAVLSAATFKAARTLARDEVTSFLREPFVEGKAHSGEDEEPVQTGGVRAGDRRARHVLPLCRDVGGRRARCDADPRAEVRAPPDVVARSPPG